MENNIAKAINEEARDEKERRLLTTGAFMDFLDAFASPLSKPQINYTRVAVDITRKDRKDEKYVPDYQI